MIHIEESNEFWKGCTIGEAMFIVLGHATLPLAFLPLIDYRFVLAFSLISILFGLMKTTEYVQAIKRSKPDNFYQKKTADLFGFFNKYLQYNVYIKS